MKKFLLFILSAAVLLGILSCTIRPKIEAYDYVECDTVRKGFDANEENTLDAVFMGDSEVFSGVSPLDIYQKSGIKSCVFSYRLMRLADIESALSYVFEKQSPSVIVLNMSSVYFSGGIMDQENDEALTRADHIFPYLHYHIMYKTLPSLKQLLKGRTYKEMVPQLSLYRNYRPKTGVVPAGNGAVYMTQTSDVDAPADESLTRLENIEKLCEENHAQLVLMAMPNTWNWTSAKHNFLVKYAEEHDLPYFDLNTENVIDWNSDSCDGGDHLNDNGAKKADAFISEFLLEHFDLNTDKSSAWDEAITQSIYGGNQ